MPTPSSPAQKLRSLSNELRRLADRYIGVRSDERIDLEIARIEAALTRLGDQLTPADADRG